MIMYNGKKHFDTKIMSCDNEIMSFDSTKMEFDRSKKQLDRGKKQFETTKTSNLLRKMAADRNAGLMNKK